MEGSRVVNSGWSLRNGACGAQAPPNDIDGSPKHWKNTLWPRGAPGLEGGGDLAKCLKTMCGLGQFLGAGRRGGGRWAGRATKHNLWPAFEGAALEKANSLCMHPPPVPFPTTASTSPPLAPSPLFSPPGGLTRWFPLRLIRLSLSFSLSLSSCRIAAFWGAI